MEKYFDNDYVYLYYKFLDKWHVRAKDFGEIFSMLDYSTVEAKMQAFNEMLARMKRGD